MQFGLNFFPCVGPEQKPAERYFREAMHLCSLTDELGYTHIRQVEHYFKPYGGYSPNPLIFLTAAAMRTKNTRLITGAVLPAFNKPLKMAGEIGMLDGISNGRLEVGLRPRLPAARVRGVRRQPRREPPALHRGACRRSRCCSRTRTSRPRASSTASQNITSLPRPTQKPHPPFWIAATNTPETFAFAGTQRLQGDGDPARARPRCAT